MSGIIANFSIPMIHCPSSIRAIRLEARVSRVRAGDAFLSTYKMKFRTPTTTYKPIGEVSSYLEAGETCVPTEHSK